MKKFPKILSMVLVVGLIAAIPASAKILAGSSIASPGESDLPMLILVNRLELSEEQMDALNGILSDLVDEKEAREGLTAEFEEAMIEFNGTGEELDAMLVTFREEQQALAEALGESIEASLDEVRDLLSINQGLVLQEMFPQLMGGALLGNDHGNSRLQNVHPMMENRMPSSSMGRAGMMGQNSGNEDMETMIGQRLGQDVDEDTIETMREQMKDRLEQMGDHGNLFEFLEQITDVLDLKLEAME